MDLHIRFCTAPITRPQPLPADSPGAGARAEFYGTVRGTESGSEIRGLRYEIYESMAEKQLRRILLELEVQHPCTAVSVNLYEIKKYSNFGKYLKKCVMTLYVRSI